MTPTSTAPTRFLLMGLALLGLAACDVSDPLEGVDLILDVTDAPVELDAASGTVDVRSGETSSTSSTVANETDIEEVKELRTIRLDPSYFRFESVAAASGAGAAQIGRTGAASGTLTAAVFVNGVPIPGIPVEVGVVDGAVTDVTPRSISLLQAAVRGAALNGLLGGLSDEDQPVLEPWEEMSQSEIIARINEGLGSQDVPISLVVHSEGLDGTFHFQKFEFGGRVALSR